MKKKLARLILVGTLLMVGTAVVGGWLLLSYVETPIGEVGTGTIIVRPGTSLKTVLHDLDKQGVLSRPQWMYAYARLTKQTEVRTGTYALRPHDTPQEILKMLVRGRVMTATFVIPEGFNRWQIRDLLAQQKWVDPKRFDALCDDKWFLQRHQIPGPSCEGYFFPETYRFARGVAAEKILEAAFRLYRRHYKEVTAQGSGPLELQEKELVTLASIVEKETSDATERPRIACVFYNRMTAKPPWRLDTDPTVIYAATLEDPNFDGNIRRYHLRQLDNPYNTYKRTGLPPGPIASPGRAALQAVIKPSTCKDFFFVSMNNGRHEFCPTLDCHNRAVQKWQLSPRRRR